MQKKGWTSLASLDWSENQSGGRFSVASTAGLNGLRVASICDMVDCLSCATLMCVNTVNFFFCSSLY